MTLAGEVFDNWVKAQSAKVITINANYAVFTAWMHDQIVSDLGRRDDLCFIASRRIASAVQEAMSYTPIASPCVFSADIPPDQILVRSGVTGELLAKIINLPTPAEISTKEADASEFSSLQT